MQKTKKKPENNGSQPLFEETIDQLKLGQAILLSVGMDSAFRLYSYRVLSPEAFLEQVDNLVKEYKSIK